MPDIAGPVPAATATVQASTPHPPLDTVVAQHNAGIHDIPSENGPSRKRRKQSPPISLLENLPIHNGDYVTLVRRELYLTFADGGVPHSRLPHLKWEPHPSLPIQTRDNSSLPVKLTSIEHKGSDSYHVVLTTLEGHSLIDANVLSKTISSVIQDLHYAIHISTLKPSSPTSNITRSSFLWSAPEGNTSGCFRLQTVIQWKAVKSPEDLNPDVRPLSLRSLFAASFGRQVDMVSESYSPQHFYNSIHVPPKHAHVPTAIHSEALNCQLYPFQRRAVRWLLQREGTRIDGNGTLSNLEAQKDGQSPPSFFQTVDRDGRECLVSHLFSAAITDVDAFRSSLNRLRGGILAEEMGLGKTVEMIALICLHRRPLNSGSFVSSLGNTDTNLRPGKGTLIITPPVILQQWIDELDSHAPSLKVLHYEGMRSELGTLENEELLQEILDHDVVLTTYNVLAAEIHYAGPTSTRSLRHAKMYKPKRSPLAQIEWWRVCLDEAQMVESGVSNAAVVARTIPRCNAWAVSGTPVRKNVKDLLGLLIFLRFEPYCQSGIWNRLVEYHPETFVRIFGQIALRHSKDFVRDELQLPPQKRVVINVPFTEIEEQHYAHIFQQMCDDCGLERDGSPLLDSWDPNSAVVIEKMRRWLTRLRQTCLHPEVGGHNRRALGHKDGPLRTVSQVLDVMIDQTETAIRTEERTYLQSKAKRGQLLENEHQSRQALEIWMEGLQESESVVGECRAQLHAELQRAADKAEKAEKSDRTSKHDDDSDMSEVDGEDKEQDTRLGTYRMRLRNALELHHIFVFFVANAHYQIKSNEDLTEPDSDAFKELEKAETEYYERARLIRTEMLSEVARKVGRLIKKVSRKAATQAFVEIPEISLPEESGGIESRKLVERLRDVGGALNDQANRLDEWREKLIANLTMRLVDEEEGMELQGDEYDISTKQQEEVYVYLEAINAAVADRHEAITGQINALITNDAKRLLDQARRLQGHDPALMRELLSIRAQIKPPASLGSIRGIVSELRSLSTNLTFQVDAGSTRARVELSIVESELRKAQAIATAQTKINSALERELDVFRSTSNARIEYYRQLQQISDTVEPYQAKGPITIEPVLHQAQLRESSLKDKIASSKAKRRYLEHLRTESTNKEPRICVICQQSFEIGALTVCGHQYCKDCMRMWWSEHRSCPICKKRLSSSDFHQISYKPQELHAQEDDQVMGHEPESGPLSSAIYSGVGTSTLAEINNIDLDGSYGSKIDGITRHLLWLREHDPGAKSVVFSQYRDFLSVLERAFLHFKIGNTTMDYRGGAERFRKDPSMECFLLHAKAQSSGLNLVNATHVFLCEPLINTALELQAIARVHRIGQYRPTTVWMYLVNDTVEESIYEISVARRLAHMGQKSNPASCRASPELMESRIDAANSMELQQAPLAKLLATGASAGELVEKDDLWQCLFGKAKRASKRSIKDHPEVARHVRAAAAEDRARQLPR